MKIFYDSQAFSLQDYGGVSRIFSELKNGSDKLRNFEAYISIVFSNNVHLASTNTSYSQFVKRREIIKRANRLLNIAELLTKKIDLYHPTYYDTSMGKYARTKPMVITFHDLTQERFVYQFPALRKEEYVIKQKKEAASRADHIIAVSENTKADLIDIYGIDSEKVSIIPLGSSFTQSSPTDDLLVKEPYLLYVGNRAFYKNFQPFVVAAAPVLKLNSIKLVRAGGNQFNADEHQIFKANGIEHLIIHKEINDKILANLYTGALAFVFPSLYEGFGIPILEAFSCNCPCVLSGTSSLPEVAGNAAIYFDPYSSESIVESLNRIIFDSDLRNGLIMRGTQRLRDFSWEKHVSQTVRVYKSLL